MLFQREQRESGVGGLELAALVMTLLGALALRLYGLGSESIWLDEATSLFLAKMNIREMVNWTAVDIHPPLYYLVLHFWLALGESEVVVRLLSVLFGMASVLVLYLLARRLFDGWVAVGAAALLAVSPVHVLYSQQARMYALLCLFGLLTTYFMVLALRDHSRLAWPAYLLCTALSLYTHYYTFFILFFQAVVAVYLAWRKHMPRSQLWKWLIAQAIALGLFAPWLPVLVRQVQSGGGAWVARTGTPGLDALAAIFINYTLGPDLQWYAPWLRRLAYALSGAVGLIGVVVSPFVMDIRRPQRSAGVAVSLVISLAYLVVPVATAWLISQVKPLYSLRYLLPFLPPYLILVSQGANLVRIASRAFLGLWSAVPWLVLVGALLAVGLVGVTGAATQAQGDDWRGVAAHIMASAHEGDVVLFTPGWNAKPFDYYARGRVALVGDTPIPIQQEQVEGIVAQAAAGRSRLWLVEMEGHYADPQRLLHAYLAERRQLLEESRFRGGIIVTLYGDEK